MAKANPWFRLYTETIDDEKLGLLSADAVLLSDAAHTQAEANRTCYPSWAEAAIAAGLDKEAFRPAFAQLCEVGIIFRGFPSLLTGLARKWPVAPMFGPVKTGRPSAEVWAGIRQRIFQRDDYTCQYCGARGGVLECDHVLPVARGGGHCDDNLATACFDCNRSKSAKLVEEWRSAA